MKLSKSMLRITLNITLIHEEYEDICFKLPILDKDKKAFILLRFHLHLRN